MRGILRPGITVGVITGLIFAVVAPIPQVRWLSVFLPLVGGAVAACLTVAPTDDVPSARGGARFGATIGAVVGAVSALLGAPVILLVGRSLSLEAGRAYWWLLPVSEFFPLVPGLVSMIAASAVLGSCGGLIAGALARRRSRMQGS
jgi:hypothetical protein